MARQMCPFVGLWEAGFIPTAPTASEKLWVDNEELPQDFSAETLRLELGLDQAGNCQKLGHWA